MKQIFKDVNLIDVETGNITSVTKEIDLHVAEHAKKTYPRYVSE